MIRSQVFRKYFLIAVATLFTFLVFGFYMNKFIFDYAMNQNNKTIEAKEPLPPLFMARILDRINPTNKLAGIIELESWHHKEIERPTLMLFSDDGKVLYPSKQNSPIDWPKHLPQEDYSYIKTNLNQNYLRTIAKTINPMMGPHMGPGGPPPMPPPPGGPQMGPAGGPPPMPPPVFNNKPKQMTLVKLAGNPVRYLGIMPRFNMGPNPNFNFEKPSPWLFWLGPISMLISLLLGIAVALSVIYNSVQKQIEVADSVISKLQHGDLKARFPVGRKDEFGQAMNRFNLMANEIEKLVLNLQEVEKTRNKLLQELAHDLRTPLTSMRSMLETVITRDEQLSKELRLDLLNSCNTEIKYFSQLVDDLLFLSQISDPHYSKNQHRVDIEQTLNLLVDGYKLKFPDKEFSLNFQGSPIILNSETKVIERLLRNAIENGVSFAKHQLKIEVTKQAQNVLISIQDDGPGFSDQGLLNFGQKKASRFVDTTTQGRISVGLGSVAMQTICDHHNGELIASNRKHDDGTILGANVKIRLPLL